jgi:hypothetical protein
LCESFVALPPVISKFHHANANIFTINYLLSRKEMNKRFPFHSFHFSILQSICAFGQSLHTKFFILKISSLVLLVSLKRESAGISLICYDRFIGIFKRKKSRENRFTFMKLLRDHLTIVAKTKTRGIENFTVAFLIQSFNVIRDEDAKKVNRIEHRSPHIWKKKISFDFIIAEKHSDNSENERGWGI